jgi:D-arabinose 1-dehydrogenase-like Zn-dependent alcohol dehydrogenase
MEVLCMGCNDQRCDFKLMKLHRRNVGDDDIEIKMQYCGVCHSDLHNAAGHLSGIRKLEYPMVPGHELAGIVVNVGKNVTSFKIGDSVGVGCMVDSCLECKECLAGNEHKCLKENTGTYQGENKFGRAAVAGSTKLTLGGYTNIMVVHYKFAILIPKSYPLEMAGPVMCAGVTMYSPLSTYGVKSGSNVGILGLGGLGQMGVRIAKAMGAKVTVISSSESKRSLATKCGADSFVISSDKTQMSDAKGTLDLILNTVPSYHNYVVYQTLLTKKGIQVLLGLHAGLAAAMFLDPIVGGTSRIKMSGIGSIKETQEVINLCDQHRIYPDISVVPVTDLNKVYTDLDSSNATGTRYVLDIANTLREDIVCDAPPPTISPDTNKMSLGYIMTELFGLMCCCRCW